MLDRMILKTQKEENRINIIFKKLKNLLLFLKFEL